MLKRLALLLLVIALAAPSVGMAACHAPEQGNPHAMAMEQGDRHAPDLPDEVDGPAVGCIGCSLPPGRAIDSGGIAQAPVATISAGPSGIPESRSTTPDTPPPRS